MNIFEQHETRVKEYLNEHYPDVLTGCEIEICEDGKVFIDSWIIIETGIKLQK